MSETETNTNISIKQRVVGAVVLISLAVIFIPMVLDGEGPFETGNSKTFIPDEPRFKFETPSAAIDSVATHPAVSVADVDVATDAATDAGTFSGKEGRPEQDTAPVLTPKRANDDVNSDLTDKNVSIVDAIFDESVSKKALLAKSEIKNRTGDTSDDVMPAPIKAAPDLETEKPVVKTKEKNTKKVVKKNPQVSEPKAKIAALKKNKNETVKSWAVQLGSFKTKPNALRLRDKLRGKGFPSYVEAVTHANGARYRVRVGPELKRANAIKLKKRLAKVAKLDGLIVSH